MLHITLIRHIRIDHSAVRMRNDRTLLVQNHRLKRTAARAAHDHSLQGLLIQVHYHGAVRIFCGGIQINNGDQIVVILSRIDVIPDMA